MTNRWLSLTLTLASVLLLIVGSSLGVAAAAYTGGELRSTEKVSLEVARDATLEVLNTLGFTVTREKDFLGGEFRLRALGGNKIIEVKVIERSDTLTEIRIRVIGFGDKSLAVRILRAIEELL